FAPAKPFEFLFIGGRGCVPRKKTSKKAGRFSFMSDQRFSRFLANQVEAKAKKAVFPEEVIRFY
ncbi:MAG: hypothetical protein K2G93_08035, partial [Rikenella sp.]|nr:hypothetical protein [Rikenella sp.]